MNLQGAVELELFSIPANISTGFVFTAAAAVKFWLHIYFDYYTFAVMVLFSRFGLSG